MKQHKALLWTGRISGLVMSVFFLTWFIREGWPSVIADPAQGVASFLPFGLLTLLGTLIAWFRPLPGSRLLFLGALALAVYFININEIQTGALFVLPALLIGLCFSGAASRELI